MSAPTNWIDELVVASLADVFGSSVYPGNAPDRTLPPYAIYQTISSTPTNTLADGIPIENDRYQIDVYSTTRLEAESLAADATETMLAIAYPVTVVFISQASSYDAPTRFFRVMLEFSVWHTSVPITSDTNLGVTYESQECDGTGTETIPPPNCVIVTAEAQSASASGFFSVTIPNVRFDNSKPRWDAQFPTWDTAFVFGTAEAQSALAAGIVAALAAVTCIGITSEAQSAAAAGSGVLPGVTCAGVTAETETCAGTSALTISGALRTGEGEGSSAAASESYAATVQTLQSETCAAVAKEIIAGVIATLQAERINATGTLGTSGIIITIQTETAAAGGSTFFPVTMIGTTAESESAAAVGNISSIGTATTAEAQTVSGTGSGVLSGVTCLGATSEAQTDDAVAVAGILCAAATTQGSETVAGIGSEVVSLTLLTSTLPNASIGNTYSGGPLSAVGGNAPYTYSILRSAVGAALNDYSSVNEWDVSGTNVVSLTPPCAIEPAVLDIQVTDSSAATVVGQVSINVAGPSSATPIGLRAALIGNQYTALQPAAMILATGVSGTASFAITSQTGGVNVWSIDSGTGAIFGLPTAAECDKLHITITDGANGQSFAQVFCLLVVPALVETRPSGNTGTGFFVKGGNVFNASGKLFRIRGMNRIFQNSTAGNPFAATGANTVRFKMSQGFTEANYFTTISGQHISNGQLCIVTRTVTSAGAPTNGSVDPLVLSAAVTDWVNNFSIWQPIMNQMILNIADGWGPAASTVWNTNYATAIPRLRAAGYTCPIMIDAGGGGTDVTNIQGHGVAVLGTDAQVNTMFSLDIWPDALTLAQVKTNMAALATVPVTCMIGEFGPGYGIGGHGSLTPGQIISAAEANALGWCAYAFDAYDGPARQSDNLGYAMVYQTNIYSTQADLTNYGQDVVLNPAWGVQALNTLPPIAITNPALLPAATVGVPYSAPMYAYGGLPPYKNWRTSGGPGWLVIDPVTGVLSGSPTSAQVITTEVVQVDDSSP